MEPKIARLKSGHSTIVLIVYNSWVKDIDMGICEWNLSNIEAVQSVKNYTFDHVCRAVKLYLGMNSEWCYEDMINHLKISFEVGTIAKKRRKIN